MLISRNLIVIVAVAVGVTVINRFAMSDPQDGDRRDAETTSESGEPVASLTPLRGLDVAVRSLGENDFSKGTSRVAVEAYRDEDFGTLTYVTKSGAVAAMPQPHNFELRILPFERYYETIRFSPIAGIAWRLDLRSAKWQLIGEPEESIAPGDYDIEMFHITDTTMVVMRIDQLTGRTWTMTGDKWVSLKEPASQVGAE